MNQINYGQKAEELLNGANIFLTGGTGSFGKAFVGHICRNYRPNKLIIFSRDELKQWEMQEHFSTEEYPFLRYFIGDVRDHDRLVQAMRGVDYVIHAAAMKQVPTAEYNPFECVKTNIHGSQAIIDVSIQHKIKRVIALSTDKAANPVNLYGATKLAADKLFVAANHMAGDTGTRFSVVRYGNVIGSRGSIIPIYKKLIAQKAGELPITDERMTRFWITLEQGVEFVIKNLIRMSGGEIFVPKIPSTTIVDLAKAMSPESRHKFVGIRPGEKLHEVMIPRADARNALEYDDYYVIQPSFHWWDNHAFADTTGGKPVDENFEYNSFDNSHQLSLDEIRQMVDQLEN